MQTGQVTFLYPLPPPSNAISASETVSFLDCFTNSQPEMCMHMVKFQDIMLIPIYQINR